MQWAINQIQGEVYRAGMRLPSIRALAAQRGVSPLTIVEAYARLVARGNLEARKGSDFYACGRPAPGRWWAVAGTSRIDLSWLTRNMLADNGAQRPGLGVLPPSLLDADLCSSSITRLAAVDRLDRVIYASSFSNTLAANIRVGYLACRPELAESLVDTKILSGFTTPELNQRLIHKLLVEDPYVQHVRALRERLAGCDESPARAGGCRHLC